MTAENTSTGLSTSSDSSGLLDNSSTGMTPTSSTTSTTGKDDVTSSEGKSEETSAEDECLSTPKNADLGTSPIECDIWEQDCGACEKCTPYFFNGEPFSGYKCVPVAHEPVSVGEPCTVMGEFGDGVDNCEKGSLCWNIDSSTAGTCVSLCTGTIFVPKCNDPNNLCWLTSEAELPLCFQKCDPLKIGTCPQANQVCVPLPSHTGFVCVESSIKAGGGEKYDPCDFINACSEGNMCLDSALSNGCDGQSVGCCLPYCDVSLDPDPRCDVNNNEECIPWFDAMEAPVGAEDIGVCAMPS